MDNSKLIRQGGVPVGYMDGKTAVLDYDFWGCAIGKRLMQTGCAVRWQSGVAKQLNAEESGREKQYRVRVHQLRAGVEPGRKFIGYEELCGRFGGLCVSDYTVVFDGQMDTGQPEELYEQFNAKQLPKGYCGHRLSVSDLLELCHDKGSDWWYLDLEGFVPVRMTKEEKTEG